VSGFDSMELCHGWDARPFRLWSTRRYREDEIRQMCSRVCGPFWLRVEGQLIRVHGEAALGLACGVSAAYHDWIAYNVPEDDGFQKDMAMRELKVEQHMLEPPSSDEESQAEDEE